MIATYILILCASAALVSLLGVGLWRHIAPMMHGNERAAGDLPVLAALAFLMVAAAPPSLLFFAFATLVSGWVTPHFWQGKARYLASLISVGVPFLLMATALPATLTPSPVLLAGGFAASFAAIWVAPATVTSVSGFALYVIAVCAALALSPLVAPRAGSIALDAAILASAWFAALCVSHRSQGMGTTAQIATAQIIGYLCTQSLWRGAWIAGLLALVAWLAGPAWEKWRRDMQQRNRLAELSRHA